MTETVFVSVDQGGQILEVGTAYFTRRNNVVLSSFRYDEKYLSRPGAYAIDPGMPLLKGNHVPGGTEAHRTSKTAARGGRGGPETPTTWPPDIWFCRSSSTPTSSPHLFRAPGLTPS